MVGDRRGFTFFSPHIVNSFYIIMMQCWDNYMIFLVNYTATLFSVCLLSLHLGFSRTNYMTTKISKQNFQ